MPTSCSSLRSRDGARAEISLFNCSSTRHLNPTALSFPAEAGKEATNTQMKPYLCHGQDVGAFSGEGFGSSPELRNARIDIPMKKARVLILSSFQLPRCKSCWQRVYHSG